MEYTDQFPEETAASEGVGTPIDIEKEEAELKQMLEQRGLEQTPRIPQEEQPAPAEDERNFIQQAADFAAEALNLRSQEESQEQRAEGQEQVEEIQEGIDEAEDIGTVVARETTRAVAGGVAGVIEQPVRFAQQIVGQDATFNLGIAEPIRKEGCGDEVECCCLFVAMNTERPGGNQGSLATSRRSRRSCQEGQGCLRT